MIKVNCDFCGKELDEPGALMFSPPKDDIVRKYHICIKCFNALVTEWLMEPDF